MSGIVITLKIEKPDGTSREAKLTIESGDSRELAESGLLVLMGEAIESIYDK